MGVVAVSTKISRLTILSSANLGIKKWLVSLANMIDVVKGIGQLTIRSCHYRKSEVSKVLSVVWQSCFLLI